MYWKRRLADFRNHIPRNMWARFRIYPKLENRELCLVMLGMKISCSSLGFPFSLRV